MGSSGRWSGRVGAAVAAVVLVGVALGACSSSGSGSSDGSASDGPTAAAEGPASLLAGLVIADDDVRDGETAADRERGTEVDTQVTLDYCGVQFPSEALRTGRHQIDITDATGEIVGSNEAVSYEPGGARQAVDEMRGAFIDCPEGAFIESTVEGVPPISFDAFPLMEDDMPDVAADHVGARVTYTEEGGEPAVTYFAFQRRGDVMIASYSNDEARVLELANAAGRRLAAADGDAVGE
jgi:hypothetical protein